MLIEWDNGMSPEDRFRAAALGAHRAVLRAAGADELPPRPWQRRGQPRSDGELVRLAAWKATDRDVDAKVVLAGLALIGAARDELDQVEAALLFAARAAGVTFREIGAVLGLGSAQAAQQRMARLAARSDPA